MNDEPFWLEHPQVLCKTFRLIPSRHNMTLEEQMNCITRLVMFIFLILYVIGYNQSILFLILSIFIIIILYYLQKSKMEIHENFMDRSNMFSQQRAYIEKSENLYKKGVTDHITNRYTFDKYPSYFSQQVEKPLVVQPDMRYPSNSQALVGGANPKTRIAPVVSPPIYEWHYWKDNDFVVPNVINDRTTQDYYGSGYYTSPEECQKTDPKAPVSYVQNQAFSNNDAILNNASVNNPILNPNNKTSKTGTIVENFTYNRNDRNDRTPKTFENFTYITGSDTKKDCKSCSLPDPSMSVPPKQRTNGDFKQFDQKNGNEKNVRYSGDVIESVGYDETNLQYNLPSNYESTNCQRKTEMAGINNQMFTSTIVPGVYYKNQIIEPIDSNIGISFEQQIPPRKVTDENGTILYTSMDPKLYTPVQQVEEPLDVPSTYDVFDPRSNGYGTSYRGYTDKMTGRPRFYYDDVESIRRPNYLTRTEIDHLKDVDTYGPVRSDQDIRASNDTIREKVENAFKDQTLDFRTDMMTRLMRKRNAELWQLRMAPKAGMQKKF
jgi:hypothetical protein